MNFITVRNSGIIYTKNRNLTNCRVPVFYLNS